MAAKQVMWTPVEDGTYEGQHRDNTICVDGEWLKVKDPEWNGGADADIALPDNLRLCQSTEVDTPGVPAIPDSVAQTIQRALEHHAYTCEYLDTAKQNQFKSRIDAALAWLDKQPKEASNDGS